MLPPAYSALPSRNLPSLPHRARVAVYVVMNIEHFTFGKLGTAIQPHLTSSPEDRQLWLAGLRQSGGHLALV